jgi:two-component system, NarL family, sensor kinase
MLRETENGSVIFFMAGSLIILLLIAAIVTYAFLHQKKVVQLRLRLHEEELRRQQAIFDALQEGQEKERTRLAQELHDGIGAKLSGLKMTLEYLNFSNTEHAVLISKVFSGITETLEEVREISHNLQPYFFNNSMEQLLLNLVEQHNATGNCSYSMSMHPMEKELDEHLKLHIYRIISELLNNIRKHSQADQASVQINIESDVMTVTVEDNGIGMHDGHHNLESMGLKSIRTRVEVCKGNINIDSSEKGTIVIIEIPINPIA